MIYVPENLSYLFICLVIQYFVELLCALSNSITARINTDNHNTKQ